MKLRIYKTAFLLLAFFSPLIASSQASFEAATIKPSTSTESSVKVVVTDGSFITIGQPVTTLIQIAYDLSLGSKDQVVGGPEWMRKDTFDVEAKLPVAPTGTAKTPPDIRAMVKTLLAERFKLKVHRETREIPVFALTVAKTGLKMKITPDTPKDDGSCCFLRRQGVGQYQGHGTSMETLTNTLALQPELGGKLVLDKTGRDTAPGLEATKDRYDFVLKWTPDMNGVEPADSSGPSLFTALQEQLGLRLESIKAPVQVIVIDSVERPTAN